jgi:hypothetical protein
VRNAWILKNNFVLINLFHRGKGDKKPVKPKNMDLVYLESSPTYCDRDIYKGSSGE